MSRWSNFPDAELDERLADELRSMAGEPRLGADWSRQEILPAVRSGLASRAGAPVVRSPSRPSMAGAFGAVALLAVLLVAIFARPPQAGAPAPSPVSSTSRSGDFALTITADKAVYAPGEQMDIEAVLVYDGEEETIRLWGVFDLIAGFGARQIDGPLAMGPDWEQPCLNHDLRRGEPLVRPYAKSAGWTPGEPDAEFYQQWSADPQMWLPAGRWQLSAIAHFTIGPDCAGQPHNLAAHIELLVEEPRATEGPAPTPVLAEATRSPSPTDSPSASPTEPSQAGIQCRHFVTVPGGWTEPPLGWSASVLDSTGLVSFCQMFRGPDDAEPQLTITSPGEPTGGSLVVTWLGGGCDPVVEVRFGRVGERLSLHVMETSGRPPGIVCDAANVSRGVVLALDEPVDPADIVTSLNGQPPPPQQPAPAHLCAYATDPSSEIDVTLADHLDAVTGCVAGRADQVEGGARIDNPADNTSRLLIEWTVPEICERWPAGLELWPNTAEDANTSYLLTINVRRYDGPQGCLTAVSGQSAELELRQPIQAEEVEIVLMYDGRASDSVEIGGDRYSIELAPQQSQYVAGEPIDIAAHFMFEGGASDDELTLSGYRSGLTYEQLDGELLMEGAHSLECDETTVRSGEPRPVPVQNVTGTSADDPYAAFYFEWMQTPYLWLPAGTWRVDLYVSFVVGPGCAGEEVRLRATTILDVTEP